MASFHVFAGSQKTIAHPKVRHMSVGDVFDALRLGFEDFWEKPSHYVFLCLIYPVTGIILLTWASGGNALQLLFPLMSGFALLGPFAAIGLYEISRRRELGLDTSWSHALQVRKSPAIPAIIAVGALLVVLFLIWLYTAQSLYVWLFGTAEPASVPAFLTGLLTTQQGWTLIIVGNLVGFLFALVVLSTTVIAFPLLLDRDVGAYVAIETSARAVLANPVPMMLWGLIVTIGLLAGSLPLLAGLAVTIPVLGHATWHIYRKAIVPAGTRRTAASSTK
ncbi:MAG: DUF2189 domain-containing protein [Nitratireductor sp.]